MGDTCTLQAAAFALAIASTACGAEHAAERSGAARAAVLKATQSELVPSDGAPNLDFGRVAFDGVTAVVGAPAQGSTDAGRVYLFARGQSGFSEQTNLSAGQQYFNGSLGEHVAVSGDHALIANFYTAFVLARSGSSWSVEKELGSITSNDGRADAVAIDGDTLVIGSSSVETVRIFRRSGNDWTLESTLTPDVPTPKPYFGVPVALAGDVLFVGAPSESPLIVHPLDSTPPGAVHVFRRSGTQWTRTQKLVASDTANADLFGFALAYDGVTLAVGAPGADGGGADAGAVYLFGDGASGFVEQARLVDFPSGEDASGYRVAIEGDLLATAPYTGASPGFVELFSRNATGAWEPGPMLQASGAEDLGSTLGLSDHTLVVGGTGHAYAFAIEGDTSCTPDGKSAISSSGKTESCAPYLCSAGACSSACSTSADCASGFVCDREQGQGTCVSGGGASQDSSGCALGGGLGGASSTGWFLLILAGAGRRRRRT